MDIGKIATGIAEWLSGGRNEAEPAGASAGNDGRGQTQPPTTYKSRQKRTSMRRASDVNYEPYGNSIQELYADSTAENNINPLDPIQIVDSDNEDARPSTHNSRSTKSSTQNGINPLRQQGARDGRRSDMLESRSEGRLLGGLSRRQKDAVLIADPMAKNPSFVQSSQRQPAPRHNSDDIQVHHHKGLKPVDTLNQPAGGRTNFQNNRTVRSVYADGNAKKSKSPQKTEIRENNHFVPNKKPRIEQSPKSGHSRSSAIALDDSQEIGTVPDLVSNSPASYPMPDERHSAQKAEKVHNSNSNPPEVTSQRNSLSLSKPGPNQPDLSDDDDRDLAFTRSAANQRRARENGLRSSQRLAELDRILPSSSTSPPQEGKNSIIHPPYFTAQAKRKAALEEKRVAEQDEMRSPIRTLYSRAESPDELQNNDDVRPIAATKPGRPQSQMSLCAHLVGNKNSTRITSKYDTTAARGRHPDYVAFDVKNLKHHSLPAANFYTFAIDRNQKQFAIHSKNSSVEDPITSWLPTTKILHASHVTDGSCNIVRLGLSRTQTHGDDMYLELSSDKTVNDLVQLLQSLDPSIEVKEKESDWMKRAFDKFHDAERNIQRKRQSVEVQTVANARPIKSHYFTEDAASVPQKSMSANSEQPATKRLSAGVGTRSYASGANGAAINNNQSARVSLRSTRSRPQMNFLEDDGAPPNVQTFKYSETGRLGPQWANPLVYRATGNKRGEVDFDDLKRLDDDEFLNDNLINLFLIYLQHQIGQTHPEVLKKMHFFNSYFHATLNKGIKGKKGINYAGVAKWSRTVDLFSRDFVIVPVNENLHWFVAIICNLPYFMQQRPADQDEDVDVDHDEAIIEHSTNQGEDLQILRSDQPRIEATSPQTDETQKSFGELSIQDRYDNLHSSKEMISSPTAERTPTSGKKARRKQIRRSLPKYDIEKPVIITLDSLGSARGATCMALKQYIAQEARDKKNLEIDTSEIRGMTAKGIPIQGNFSDCGLYMCMYMEQFMRDPYAFVSRILQREERQLRWPKEIQSHDLRARLREMVLALRREQDGQPQEKAIPEVGKILIDLREPSPEYIPDFPPTTTKLGDGMRYQSDIADNRSALSPERPSSSSEKRLFDEALALVDKPDKVNEDDPIVIEDNQSQSQSQGGSRKKMRRISHKTISPHTQPSELAASLRKERSPKKQITPRAERATSEILIGMESYESSPPHPSPPSVPRREELKHTSAKRPQDLRRGAEVPETPPYGDDNNHEDDTGDERSTGSNNGEMLV